MTVTTPNVLYHYCPVDSFYEIINNKSIWLSNSYLMNDYLENKWIDQYINEAIEKYQTNKNRQLFVDFNDLWPQKLEVPFVACFSESSDMLSQWRAYANDATGFSVGFNTSAFHFGHQLPRMGSVEMIYPFWHRVIYEQQLQRELVFEVFERYKEDFGTKDRVVRSSVVRRIVTELAVLMSVVKNPKFSEEMEWRLVYISHIAVSFYLVTMLSAGNIGVRFRRNKNRILPYIPVNLTLPDDRMKSERYPITELWFGPKNECDWTMVNGFLQVSLFPYVRQYKSEVSYR